MNRRSLTLRYSIHQFIYWAGYCCVYPYAAAYLLEKGFSAAVIGGILFAANFISFLLQPLLAGVADRAKKGILPFLTGCLSAASFLCFTLVRYIPLSKVPFALFYLAGIFLLDMQIPLLNALSVYYTDRSWKINYGVGRGIGGLGFSLASLGIGYVMEDFGVDMMPPVAILLIALCIFISFTYPKDDSRLAGDESEAVSSSLFEFIRKYGWYTASLLGVLFLALIHAMTENYFIEVMRSLGGDSSNVGVALFIATFLEMPAMMVFARVHKKLGSQKILFIAGISFIVKMLLLLTARSITAVYFIQLLQVTTYVFLSTDQMYYSRECVGNEDMVRGQSFITAAYALGCAFGNLVGGVLLSASGVKAMLIAAVAGAVLGTVCLVICVPRALKSRAGSVLEENAC